MYEFEDADTQQFLNSDRKTQKMLKCHCYWYVINTCLNTLFIIVFLLVIVKLPFIQTLNHQTGNITESVKNYLDNIIPKEIDNYNRLIRKMDLLLIQVNSTVVQLNSILPQINRIISIPNLDQTIATLLNQSEVVLGQVIKANVTRIGYDISNMTWVLNKMLDKIP